MKSKRARKLKRLLIIPDTHAPFEHKGAFELMLKVGERLKPDIVVVLGDFFDFYSLSAHPPENDRQEEFELELLGGRHRLDEVADLGAERKVFIAGNHEQRLERYLARNAPKLYRSLSLPKLLGLQTPGREWEYVPYKQSIQIGRVHYTHDTGYSGKGAASKSRADFEDNAVIGHCLPIDYEVFVQGKGWAPLSSVEVGSSVLGYDPNTKSPSWSHVKDTTRRLYSGKMAKFNRRGLRQKMTEDHAIFTSDGRYVGLKDALDSVTCGSLVYRALPMDTAEYPISDNMLKLLVASCADASYAGNNTRFHLKKKRKLDRLSAIVLELGYSVDVGEPNEKGNYKFSLPLALSKEIRKYCPTKVLPDLLLSLSARQRQLVIDELPLWDGSVLKHDGVDYGSRQFCSAKPKEIELVQLMLLQHGLMSTLNSRGRIISYNVSVAQPDLDSSISKLRAHVKWEDVENEDVGCLTTSTSNFFVRNTKGAVSLSGNCHKLEYFVTGCARGVAHVGASFGWLGDPDKADYMHAIKAKRDWAHGFGVGLMDETTGVTYLQPIPIVRVGDEMTAAFNGEIIKEPLR
jgi:hypothetical protein